MTTKLGRMVANLDVPLPIKSQDPLKTIPSFHQKQFKTLMQVLTSNILFSFKVFLMKL